MTSPTPNFTRRTFALGALGLGAAGLLSACSGKEEKKPAASGKPAMDKQEEKQGAANAKLPGVFASTIVWGSVAQAVGGEYAKVTSAIERPDQDPHDYEPSARQLADAKEASIVLLNGGGYDDWVLKMASDSAVRIDAVTVSGLKKPGEEEFNEHVFYDVDTVEKVARDIAKALSDQAPDHKAEYEQNAEAFVGSLASVRANMKKFADEHKGLTALATEPVVGYLLEDLGIEDVTPEEFVEQSETEAGVSAAVAQQAVTLINDGKVKILVLNAQTEDRTSDTLLKAATEKKVPVAKVYETFPEGVTTYQVFLEGAVKQITDAAAA
ncbi:metal ABC transporter solute-binding protein, Zn/Mn family [Dermabacteraceae bacterium P13095]